MQIVTIHTSRLLHVGYVTSSIHYNRETFHTMSVPLQVPDTLWCFDKMFDLQKQAQQVLARGCKTALTLHNLKAEIIKKRAVYSDKDL